MQALAKFPNKTFRLETSTITNKSTTPYLSTQTKGIIP